MKNESIELFHLLPPSSSASTCDVCGIIDDVLLLVLFLFDWWLSSLRLSIWSICKCLCVWIQVPYCKRPIFLPVHICTPWLISLNHGVSSAPESLLEMRPTEWERFRVLGELSGNASDFEMKFDGRFRSLFHWFQLQFILKFIHSRSPFILPVTVSSGWKMKWRFYWPLLLHLIVSIFPICLLGRKNHLCLLVCAYPINLPMT